MVFKKESHWLRRVPSSGGSRGWCVMVTRITRLASECVFSQGEMLGRCFLGGPRCFGGAFGILATTVVHAQPHGWSEGRARVDNGWLCCAWACFHTNFWFLWYTWIRQPFLPFWNATLYVNTHTHVYTYVHIHTYIYMYICIYTHVHNTQQIWKNRAQVKKQGLVCSKNTFLKQHFVWKWKHNTSNTKLLNLQ